MNRELLDNYKDSVRVEHFVKTMAHGYLTFGGYIKVGGIKIEDLSSNYHLKFMEGLSNALHEEVFKFLVFDGERSRELTITLERYNVRKRIFGDKIGYRLGLFPDGLNEGYLVSKSLPDIFTRAIKIVSRNFEDPLMDEQTSLLALQQL